MTRKFKIFLLLLAISLFLMLGLGPRFGWLGAVGFFLMIADFIYALFGPSEKKTSQIQETLSKQPKAQIRTSQKIAVIGTVCFFLAIPFFFIAWPIGLILLISAFICAGAFHGFQSTEKTEDLRKIRERLETPDEPNLCPHCEKYYQGNPNFCPNCGGNLVNQAEKESGSGVWSEIEIKEKPKESIWTKQRSDKWAWIVGGIILFLIFISVISKGGEKEGGPAQISQPSIQKEEQKFSCEEKIELLGSIKPTKTGEKFKIVDINTNIKRYPLNKKEVNVEHCVKVANFTPDMIDLELMVKFFDKEENVLAETDGYIFDIPGGRTKTYYGSKFIESDMAREIETVHVSAKIFWVNPL